MAKYSVDRESETRELTEPFVLAEWGHDTLTHATGDRTAVHRRVVVHPDRDGFVSVLLQERREMTLGPDARRDIREHDWQTLEAVDMTPDGTTHTDYTD